MPNSRSDGVWWVVLVVLAIVSRAGAVLVLQSHLVPHSTYEHGEIAAHLLAGRGFSVEFLGSDGPTSQQAPVYPFLVAGAYALGGVETARSLLILELGQAVLGGLLVAGILVLSGEVAPGRRWAGRIAGLIGATHPTLIYAATHVQVAILAATLTTWTLALGYRLARTGAWRDAGLTGFVLATLVLTDPILGLAGLGVVGAVVRRRGWRGSVRSIGVVGLVVGAGIAPWMVRNYRVHGEVVFIKSTFGYAFWQGNCALSNGTDKVVRASVERALQRGGSGLAGWNRSLWEARHEAGYLDDVALTAGDYAMLGGMGEPERSRVLFRRAMAELREEPWRYPRLCLRRLRYFLLFDETNPKTRSLVYRAGHVGLTVAAIAGWLAMGSRMRRRVRPTLVVVGAVALFHAMTIVSARFHVPIEPIMAVWTGVGLGRSIGRRGQGKHKLAARSGGAQPRWAMAS